MGCPYSIQINGFQVSSRTVSTTKAIRKVGAIRASARPSKKGSRGFLIFCLETRAATATATPTARTDAVMTMLDLGIADPPRQAILTDMRHFLLGVILLLPLSLFAQKLKPCKPDTPALKMENSLQASGLHVGGVEEFPAGLYKPLGTNDDGTFYIYEKPLVAKLMADTVKVRGGLFIPSDPDDDARGWYSMPDEAKNAVVAPEEGIDSAWEGDPTQPAANPYQAANLSKLRRLTGLSDKPKLTPVTLSKP